MCPSKSLVHIFTEHRVVRATYFGVHDMPAVAVFTLNWQIVLGGAARSRGGDPYLCL
ncbi:MAG: hypothetical protein GPOALKHO_000278 [Sodalis sp.]|uniref:DUF412 family protein n=1 Tax=Sodalis sp. (in: enterobacteria) TaxID=1898979 RepID=UPI00387381B8|nr:MAG: hypothetical protein GPOALKHO_000278 [Sodalis sp.]